MNAMHVEDLIDGYALAALDRTESAHVRDHLRDCDGCRRVLAETRQVLSVLPRQLEPLTPRPSVKASLLAAARADDAVSGRYAAADRPARLLPFRMDRGSSNAVLRWASLGVAAAFIIGLVGGLTGWAVVLGDRLDKRKDDLGKSHDTIETLLHSDHVVRLQSTYAGLDVRAVVAIPATGTGALLVVSDVPSPTAGDAYHLWFFSDGVAQSNGVLTPDANGDITTSVNIDLARYDRIEIDLQSSDATAPGGQLVIAGALR